MNIRNKLFYFYDHTLNKVQKLALLVRIINFLLIIPAFLLVLISKIMLFIFFNFFLKKTYLKKNIVSRY
jgi:hypothetical protein